jgi:hypothetical protein
MDLKKADNAPTSTVFKNCPICKKSWACREDFLSDQQLDLDGYQADFENLDEGLFFFTHNQNSCHTTMSIQVRRFLDLYNGPRYKERKTGGPECPGFCRTITNLEYCTAKCECSYVREILYQIRKRLGAL